MTPTPNPRIPSVISGNNAHLIATIAPLYIKATDVVVDPTYGKGKWWTQYRPERLIAHDRDIDGVDFLHLPEDDATVDVVAFDPPYVSTGNKATSTIPGFYDAYGLGEVKGWQAIFALMAAGMKETSRIIRPGGLLMVKSCDAVESGPRRWGHDHVVATAADLGLVRLDEFIHHTGLKAQSLFNSDGTPRVWKHAHCAHSFLSVFRQPRRGRR